MEILNQSVGVDVSKAELVVYFEVMYKNQSTKKVGQRKFDNTLSGIKKLVKWIDKRSDSEVLLQVVMEATGRYHEALAYHLCELHYRVCIVLPNRIKHFARSLNQFSKTDPIDAAIIAHYGACQVLDAWLPASPLMRRLRELTRERQDLIKMRTQVTNRRCAMRASARPQKDILERLNLQLDFFNDQIDQIEAHIAQLKHQDNDLSQQITRLTSVPYIGVVTASIILAETSGFQLFENRNQLIKYAGLDVVERQSGSSIKGKSKISKRGNAHLRGALYMPAVGAISKPGVFQDIYQRCLQRHGNTNKALMAVQRKLLLVAFGLHQSQQMYDPEIHRLRTLNGVGELHGSPTVAHLVT
ncbi:MAG: IS110 family transposase [Bacteroidota bacterium]